MSAYKKELLVSAVLAIVIVLGLGGFAQFASQIISPTPTPTPGPKPPPKLDIRADLASTEGFNRTVIEFQGELYPVLVLPPGGTGSISISLISTGDQDYTVSLDVDLAGMNAKFEGVKYTFSPPILNLKVGATVNSILSIAVDSEAPTAFYSPMITANIKEWGGIGTAFFDLLIYHYTPTYIFRIVAPAPGMPAPMPIPETAQEETPQPPTDMPPTPTTPKPPSVEVTAGETVYIMFYIDKGTDDPSVQANINLAYDSGSQPLGIDAKYVYDPLKVVPVLSRDSVIIVTLTAAKNVPDGKYRITATISVDSYTTERTFYLLVISKVV